MLNDYERKVLAGWEDVFYKAQLSLWIFLALRDNPKHMAHIKDYVVRMTNGLLSPDDKSVYRALRRLSKSELIQYEMQPGDAGPDRKVYALSRTGQTVLTAFLKRNISGVLYQPKVQSIIEKG